MDILFENVRRMAWERAKSHGDRPFVNFEGQALSFAEFDRLSDKLAGSLSAAGVAKGDIVYLYMNNSARFLTATAAVLKIGAVAGPTNTWLKGAEIQYQYNDSKGGAVVVDPEFLPVVEKIRPDCPHLKTVVVNLEKPKGDALSLPAMIEGGPEGEHKIPLDPADLAFIFYTSGSTGNPKGALLTHRNVMFELASLRKALELPGDDVESTVALIFLPLFHVNAMMSMLASLYRGIGTVLLKKFSVREFGPVVERYGVTFFSAVPKVYKILIEARDVVGRSDLSSLKYGICGAAPMPVETIRRFEETYGVEILEGYGLTEGTVASTLHRRGGVKKIGSIGQALPGHEVKIFGPDDRELPPGEAGEIRIRGENVMAGYLGLEEETSRAMRGGWLHTGDVGYVDGDGFFFIVDREKDMIIKGGENIYPKEIENAIAEMPGVYDAAVVGVPDELSGESVKAFVVPRIGRELTEEAVIAHCRERLADFKVPSQVEFVIGLPSNAVGKALKRLLREGKGVVRLSDLGGEGETLAFDPVFQMMPFRFKGEKAAGWEAEMQYELYGPGGGVWTVRVTGGKMETEKAPAKNPTSVVRMYSQTFRRIVAREMDGLTAMNSGLMQVEGAAADMALLAEAME